MKSSTARLLTPLAGVLLTASLSIAQEGNKEVIAQEMEGHIFRPKQLQATPANVAQLTVPAGFTIHKFAEGLGKPRMMAVGANGSVYVTDREAGTVTLLQDKNKDGKAEVVKTVARRKNMHGITIRDNKLYLITVNEVYTAAIKPDGTLGSLQEIMKGLPDGGQHGNRTLHFGPDGMLYVSIGSTCNACKETSGESATMIQAKADGSRRRIYAKGLRNTIGFDWHPQTKELWGFDHGIDWLGDDEQKEELNRITDGADYGWPYVYADGKFEMHFDPQGMTHEEYARKTTKPVLLYDAHAAPMSMLFYTGSQFPADYRGDALVTMHGSWNRAKPSGYKIVRVRFEQGQPKQIEDFVTGFLTDNQRGQFARVCGLAQMPDGSLLVAEDATGVVYQVRYNPK
ncbi:PQQ-dependent sugar dehydrogenase [Larkinella insperata]|uniref:PQQ-dependent sugar dehydrogenase n=1 Tax=Larkinella insperata TaxID=332158 RepID=A0ABW3QA97_9BACT|nr:PQQ-dependent sugar dehydrogenase [Larkinella insperata]